MKTPNEDYFKNPIVNPRFLNKNYPEFFNYLNTHYSELTSISEKLYWWRHKLVEIPKCPICGKNLKYIGILKGYQRYCSYKCTGASEERKLLMERTCMEKWGVTNPFAAEEIKNKIKSTIRDMYEVDYAGQAQEVKNKITHTFQTKYNVNSPLELEITKINRENARINKLKSKYKEFIDVEDDIYIMNCPHPNCNKCKEKFYKIPKSAFFDRRRDKTEPCTNLLKFKNRDKTSGLEKEIQLILDELNISYINNNYDIISPKEIDIYIPEYNIGIECNGIYSHCSKYKPYNYHINKTNLCNSKNIKLIHIWEDWIKDKYDIVKSLLYNKLNKCNNVIYARDCQVKPIKDSKVCKEFLDKNHIQGASKSSIKLGLYYKNELVSVMTFGNRSVGSGNGKYEGEVELKRFCTKLFTRVVGGASKLFKYYVKNYNPIMVVSFSSNDISDGNLYKVLGFKQTTQSESYWWIKKGTYERFHRQAFSKNNIVKLGYKENNDNSWTEDEVMYDNGYVKIYDSGMIKWIWDKKQIIS